MNTSILVNILITVNRGDVSGTVYPKYIPWQGKGVNIRAGFLWEVGRK